MAAGMLCKHHLVHGLRELVVLVYSAHLGFWTILLGRTNKSCLGLLPYPNQHLHKRHFLVNPEFFQKRPIERHPVAGTIRCSRDSIFYHKRMFNIWIHSESVDFKVGVVG